MLNKYRQCQDFGEHAYFDADDLLDIAEYYHIKNDSINALEAAYFCSDLYPEEDKAKVFIARTHIMDGDMVRAKDVAMTILNDTNLDVVYLRAEIMLCDGEADRSETYLEPFLEKVRNGSIDVLYDEEDCMPCAEFCLDVAMLYCDYEHWQKADKWAWRAKDEGIDVECADYLETMARLLTGKGDFKSAIMYWNGYIDQDAYSVMAWMQMAQCQYSVGNCAEALSSAQYAQALNPNIPEVYLSQGNCYSVMGNMEKAQQMFERFLELEPSDVQGELLLSTVFSSMGKFEKASEHINVALKGVEENDVDESHRIPDFLSKEVYRQAANISASLGSVDEALVYADKMLLYDVSGIDHQLLRASILIQSGKLKEALDLFNQILKDSSHDPYAYIMVGNLLVDGGMYETGYNMLSQTLKILEESATENITHGYDRLAYAALATDHYDEYLSALEICVSRQPVETVTMFGHLFPNEVPVEKYVEYARKNRMKL